MAIFTLAPKAGLGAMWIPPVFAVVLGLAAGLLVTALRKRRDSRQPAEPARSDHAPAAPTAAPTSTPKATTTQSSASNLRVLVAEDNLVNRRVAELLLRKLGQVADFAADGAEAVEACARVAYDLILMDIRMPVKDGHIATREIRALEAESAERMPAYICAVTADDMDGVRERAFASGMDAFLPKPVQLQELAHILQDAASHRQYSR